MNNPPAKIILSAIIATTIAGCNSGGVDSHCRENKPFSNSNQSLVSPMVTRLGPVGFSQRPDPVRTFAGELAEDTFKQAKT